MVFDDDILNALERTVVALKAEPHHPVPTSALEPLVEIARPGLKMRVDVRASQSIGAPLVAIETMPTTDSLLEPLTKRQKEVAALIIEGLPNRTIASELGISIATVKDHVHAILAQLELPSRAALISAIHRRA